MSEMRPLPKYRDDLVELVKAYKGTIKRPLCNVYRYQMVTGKLSPARFERPVRYATGAYRADKKRPGNAPRGNYLGNVTDVTKAATRDY